MTPSAAHSGRPRDPSTSATPVLLASATVWQGAPPRPRTGGWILIDRGVVRAVGDDTTAEPAVTDRRDYTGHHILPGFRDSHSHLSISAWLPHVLDGSRWSDSHTALADIAAAASRSTDSWVIAMMSDWDDWAGGLPPLSELDRVTDRPTIIVDVSLHRLWASSAALHRIEALTAAFQTGDIEYRHGKVTGVLWESACAATLQLALSENTGNNRSSDERINAYTREADRHLSLGIVEVHDPGVPPHTADELAAVRTRSSLQLSWSMTSAASMMIPAASSEFRTDCGAGPSSAKLFLDGAHKCAMCLSAGQATAMIARTVGRLLRGDPAPAQALFAYRTEYRDRHLYMPYLRLNERELHERISTLASAGIRARIHALGNDAARLCAHTLTAEAVTAATIEHLLVLSDTDLDLVAGSGAVANLQPGFIGHYGPQLNDRGVVPSLRALPIRSLRTRGVAVALSSDNPCGPLDPLTNIRAAVNRRLPGQPALDPREAVDVAEAIHGYTLGGHHAIHGVPGHGITPGAPADLAIVNGDILNENVRVIETWINGTIAYAYNSN